MLCERNVLIIPAIDRVSKYTRLENTYENTMYVVTTWKWAFGACVLALGIGLGDKNKVEFW